MDHDLLSWPERGRLWLRLGIRVALTVAAVLLVVYGVIPLVYLLLPFVLGLVVAWVLNPVVRWLQRRLSISRKVISLVVIALIFCILGGALFGLLWAAVSEVRNLFTNWNAVTDAFLAMLSNVNGWIEGLARFLPDGVNLSLDSLFTSLAGWVQSLDISGWLANLAGRAPSLVSGVSGFVVGVIVFLMASYFITGDYPRLRFLVTDRMPADVRKFWGSVRTIFMEAFGGYLKSQLILTLGVFVILSVGFTVTGQSYGLVLAGALSVLDFIPIIGSGTVMVPWMVIDIITGEYGHAVGFAVIWGLVVLFRRVAEPKILGDQTGLSPILSLLGIYAGMRLGGVPGMIVGPLLILVCINLAKLGIFRPVANDLTLAFHDVRAILRQDQKKS